MIRLTGVTKRYRTHEMETTALRNVNLTIEKGEFLAVLGPSGCGKSTLLNVLGMIDTVSEGEYVFNGKQISRCSESELAHLRRGKVGFIFQAFNLIDDLSVYQNVELPLIYQGATAASRRNLVREALELVGLEARTNHRPNELSGGQQQRVAVARAVVTDPDLLLADEPTGNLDTANGEEIMAMLQKLNEVGATLVMVTHSEDYASRAHRRVSLLDGEFVSGTNQLQH